MIDDQEPKPTKEPMTLAQYAEKAAEEAIQESRGLVCPKCACTHFEVVYTKPISMSRIQRRRACRNCGHRVTTTERIIG